MRSMIARTVVLMWAFASGPVAAAALKVGDSAPPLGKKIEWLKGGPIDLAQGRGKDIYVLDFWATWCAPCIMQFPHATALQKRFGKQGVRFVALTSPGWQRQRVEDVRRFVKSQGERMGFTVGFDHTEEAHNNYMVAAGATGIPYTFVVSRWGKIAWQGFPNEQLEHVLERMVAGEFDIKAAAAAAGKEQKLAEIGLRFNRAAAMRQWEQALSALGEMLQVDEAYADGIEFSLRIINDELRDRARVRAWVKAYLRDHRDNAAGLTLVARSLMTFPELGDRHPDLALAAAQAACDADGSSAPALQAHARALHEIGKIDQAIEQQEKALALADNEAKAEVRRALEYYRACQQLAGQ